jgi:probable rRNA maturation factor
LSDDPVAVIVQDVSSDTRVPRPERLTDWVRSALGGGLRGEVTLRIVGEAESAELNARYRGRTGPTNVLAFAAGGDVPAHGPERLPAGDLVVCAAVVEREAEAQGKPPAAHWAHIVMHGALHLVGYGHETPAEAERMEARERELLADFGFPDPYA